MNSRIQHLAIGILTVFSLLASSVAACTCSHHQAETQPRVSSCQHHSEMAEMAGDHGSAVENSGDCLTADDDCVCADTAQKIVAKSSTIKLKKHTALAALEAQLAAPVGGEQRFVNTAFLRATYLSDSFYNLSPSRGPPAPVKQ